MDASSDSESETAPPPGKPWSDSEEEVSDGEMPADDPLRKLSWAIRKDTELFKTMLQESPELAVKKLDDDYTCLHMATSEGNLEAVKLLVNAGANVNSVNADGWTPLHSACKWNHVEIAKVLMHAGADYNMKTNGGLSPVHICSNNSDPAKIMSMILSRRCVEIKLKSKGDDTPEELCERYNKCSNLLEMQADYINQF